VAFKGDKKRDYQRTYMRKRGAILKLKSRFIRPLVRPQLDADGNPIPDDEQVM